MNSETQRDSVHIYECIVPRGQDYQTEIWYHMTTYDVEILVQWPYYELSYSVFTLSYYFLY